MAPPSFDSQMPYFDVSGGVWRRLPARPRMTEAHRWSAFVGSMAILEIETPVNVSPPIGAQWMPPSVDFRKPCPK